MDAQLCSLLGRPKASRRLRALDSREGSFFITQALADVGIKVRYNQLRDQIMTATACSKRTAQLAIAEACQQGWIAQANGQYLLPL